MRKISITLLIFSTLTSCSLIFPKIALKRVGVFETKSELKIIESKNQKIIFIGMHHIGKKEFYNDVAKKVDSLQELGYVVFYEKVTYNKKSDSLIAVKNAKKIRKLLGFFPEKYLDTTTNLISNKMKYKSKYKLMNQPRYGDFKVDSLTAIWGDVSMNELVTEFEKEHSEIKLDSCDYKFSLRDKKYKCKKVSKKLLKKFRNNYLKDYREKHLVNKIIESNKNKVLIIYGDAHFFGIYSKLSALDNSFILKKYKKIKL